jgi:hypothetical protein
VLDDFRDCVQGTGQRLGGKVKQGIIARKLSWSQSLVVILVAITILVGLSATAVPAVAGSGLKTSAAANAGLSLAGKWLSEGNGVVYDFVQTGASTYSGYVVDGGCAGTPGDIMDSAHGDGYYSGTENVFSSFDPCTVSGTATNTIQIFSDGETAEWNSSGCSDCGSQKWTREVVSSGCASYRQPTDWNTEKVNTATPGVEPLNVIISACSSVPLSSIYQAMSSDWKAGCSGVFKISNEQANVARTGFIGMAQAWRQGGCATGDYLSLFGREDHVRMWYQPVPDSTAGSAEFFTASFETACVELHGKLKPFRKQDGTYRTGSPWHCIDGGPGSYFKDGYDNGAKTFARAIVSFAQAQGWWVRIQVETRPANPGSIDENGVAAAGQVYVVTVDYHAPQN